MRYCGGLKPCFDTVLVYPFVLYWLCGLGELLGGAWERLGMVWGQLGFLPGILESPRGEEREQMTKPDVRWSLGVWNC